MNTVSLKDISVRFGAVRALNQVSLSLEQGEVLLLSGPNGSGKSTLIRVLLGLITPNQGQVLVDGKVHEVDNRFKARIGYLPESVAFSANLTGFQVLRFFALARRISTKRVSAVLERVGLSNASNRAVRGYSRGMRQRLGLGIAILAEPELLLLDEPTGGLDQQGLSVLWSLLDEWRGHRKSVLLTSHDLALMERHVDRVALLKAGAIRAYSTPSWLREQAHLPLRVTFTLSNDRAQNARFLKLIRRLDAKTMLAESGDRLNVTVGPEELLALIDLRDECPKAVTGLRVEEPGLDLVYERLIKDDS